MSTSERVEIRAYFVEDGQDLSQAGSWDAIRAFGLGLIKNEIDKALLVCHEGFSTKNAGSVGFSTLAWASGLAAKVCELLKDRKVSVGHDQGRLYSSFSLDVAELAALYDEGGPDAIELAYDDVQHTLDQLGEDTGISWQMITGAYEYWAGPVLETDW